MDQIKEQLQGVFDEFDKIAKQNPKFVNFCKEKGLPPGQVLAGVAGLVTLLAILIKGYDILCALLTCVYPLWCSIKAINTEGEDDDKVWLCFWTVFGVFQTVELFFGFILAFIPYYYWLRLAFFAYLMAPQTRGAQTLYEKAFSPFLKAHSEEIQAFINKAQDLGEQAKKEGMSQGLAFAKDATS